MNQLTPQTRYQQDLAQSGFIPDPAQALAVAKLQSLYEALCKRETSTRFGFVRRLLGPSEPIKSLYFWGGVGRGKTYLMDCFFETLPFERKMRTHFHRFMRRVHAELTDLKGEKNPLEKVANRLAREAGVICFDEFFVSDITDAMILANLLKALFARDVVMVMTSNIEPGGLYRNGLQRERFLPAIALLKARADVVHLDGGTDYRLRELKQVPLFYHPNDAAAEFGLERVFAHLVPDTAAMQVDVLLSVEGRPIRVRRECDDVAWFDFSALCDGPRSQNDYIVLAKEYHTVILSDVPEFTGAMDDQARRFVYLVDEFYDRKVKLILSAQKPLAELYQGGRLKFEFERAASRLLEMQSEAYLAEGHKP